MSLKPEEKMDDDRQQEPVESHTPSIFDTRVEFDGRYYDVADGYPMLVEE